MQNKSPSPLSQLNDESDHISSINGKIPEPGDGDRDQFESPDAYWLRKAEEAEWVGSTATLSNSPDPTEDVAVVAAPVVEEPAEVEPEPTPEPTPAPPQVVFSDDPELKALQKAHQHIGSRIPFEQLDQFLGLSDWVRLCGTGNKDSSKDCFERGWNQQDGPSYSPLELLSQNGYFRRTCIGAGVLTGRPGNGVLIIDFDEPADPEAVGMSAEQGFVDVFGRPSSDLPASPRIGSGKPGRFKTLLRVPPQFWPLLNNWSLKAGEFHADANGKNKRHALEVLWENGTGCCKHGTICGIHPENTPDRPLIYRWCDGYSPRDVEIAEAPDWVLLALAARRKQQIQATQVVIEQVGGENDGGEPKPADLLRPKDQIRLVDSALPFIPTRGIENAGNYDVVRRALCGLMNHWGVGPAIELVSDTEWDKQCDWSYHNLGSAAELLTSLAKSKPFKKAEFGSFLAIAKDNGWEYPDWAKPPQPSADDVMVQALNKTEILKKEWDRLKILDNPVMRSFALNELCRNLGVRKPELMEIVKTMLAEQSEENTKYDNMGAIMAAEDDDKPLIEGVIPEGVVTVFAGHSGSAKSSTLYQAAESVCNGTPFLGQFATRQSNVLIIQKDESRRNAKKKFQSMKLDLPADSARAKFIWDWSCSQLMELEQQIIEGDYKLVIMDSFTKLFGESDSMNEAAVGLYIYELNAIASRTGAAVVVAHHPRKTGGKKEDGPVKPPSLDSLYGSSFIGNGASDVWGTWDTKQSAGGDPVFGLKYLKDRSMLHRKGFTLQLRGDVESLRLTLMDDSQVTVSQVTNVREALIAELSSRAGEWISTDALVEVCQKLPNPPTADAVRRVLRELTERSATTGVERKQVAGKGKGRRGYAYRYAR